MLSMHFKNKQGKLQVAANHRYLEYKDGTPFFYLGDTAWELFHRLTIEEASYYLDNRAAKGFTVIQATALGEIDGIDVPNPNGDLPLIHKDPAKPTLDAEPRYETIPVGFYFKNLSKIDCFDDFDSRQAACWALMAGACGHTYGHNCIWQMWDAGRDPSLDASIPWHEALDHPGAYQMGLMRRLFQSRPFHELMPDQSMILDGPSGFGEKVRAVRSKNGSFAFIYSPMGQPFTINKRVFSASRVKESWFDPRYGCVHHFRLDTNFALQTYTPPTSGKGCDWILIIDDEKADFPVP